MAEQALQVWGWMAEMESNQWRVGGEEAAEAVGVYTLHSGRALFRDLDIALIQMCAVYDDQAPERICHLAVNHFGVPTSPPPLCHLLSVHSSSSQPLPPPLPRSWKRP